MSGDPGPDLPGYPPLPVVDGRLVLDKLEAWQIDVARVCTELGAALLLVDAGAAPAEDRDAVLTRMGEVDRRGRNDAAWATGYLMGRAQGLGWQQSPGQTFSFHRGLMAGQAAFNKARARAVAALGS